MKSKRPFKENTGAAVVSYNPDAGLPRRAESVVRQVAGLVVIDNHSQTPSEAIVDELSSQRGITVIRNERNRGVATALNQAARWARLRGHEWLLLLDQDACVYPDMLDTLGRVYDEVDEKDAVALIGSTSSTDRGRWRSHAGPAWVEVKTVITAGTLMSLRASDTIGPFRDELFIDLVDIEYCLRARRKGFKVVLSLQPSMDHDIGATTMHRLPWKQTGTSNHAPVRRYYMMRNHIVLAKEYIAKDPLWVLTSLSTRLKSTFLMCVFERDRLAKIRCTALGLWDGLASHLSRDLSVRP